MARGGAWIPSLWTHGSKNMSSLTRGFNHYNSKHNWLIVRGRWAMTTRWHAQKKMRTKEDMVSKEGSNIWLYCLWHGNKSSELQGTRRNRRGKMNIRWPWMCYMVLCHECKYIRQKTYYGILEREYKGDGLHEPPNCKISNSNLINWAVKPTDLSNIGVTLCLAHKLTSDWI
jgi:hypothetical protein